MSAMLVIEETSWDAGAVPPDSPIEARFLVRNLGKKQLIIHRSQHHAPSLLNAELIVPPRADRELTLRIRSPRRSGTAQQQFLFRTNDPVLSRFSIRVLSSVCE